MRKMVHRVVALVVLMLMIGPTLAWAVCAGLEGNAIPGVIVDPTASGTKWSGPLSIFYEYVPPKGEQDPSEECTLGTGNIMVVLRLKKGNDARVFGTQTTGGTLCFSQFGTLFEVVEGLIQARVDDTSDLDFGGFTSWTLKSVSNVIFNADDAVSMDVEVAFR